MKVSRRTFVRGGVTAFTFGFAAPQVLCDIAFAQGVPSRNLVVVYLGGGNDALSTVIPYRDANYYTRRPTLAVPAGSVLQIGRDRGGAEIGLHPRLTGLKSVFDSGRLAVIQRTGYENQSRSHFTGFDIWGTANPGNSQGTGWLGRYLDTLPQPVDPLVGVEHAARNPAPADGAPGRRAVDHEPGRLQLRQPEQRHRGRLRTHGAGAHLVASAGGSAAPRVRQRHHAGRARHARSRGDRGHVSSRRRLSEQRLRPGAAGGRGFDEQGDRHQGVLGPDRRLRHACRTGREHRLRTST